MKAWLSEEIIGAQGRDTVVISGLFADEAQPIAQSPVEVVRIAGLFFLDPDLPPEWHLPLYLPLYLPR